MKNRKFARAITLVLSCLLLVGAALGISAIAAPSGASAVEIAYKNVSYTGAPRLVLYTDTDKPLAANQEVKVLFWNEAPESGVYNELTADYARNAESTVIIDGKQHKAFIADGVAPSELRKTIYIRPAIVEIDGEGKEKVTALGELEEYSIFDYAVDMFASRAGATVDQYAMYSQLLDYAAAIQKVLFTNEDGSLNEKKLKEAGGWANAYYIAEVGQYLQNVKTKELTSIGESYRIYSQTPSIKLESEYYTTISNSLYMFAGFRNDDGTSVAGKSLIDDEKVSVTLTSEFSTQVQIDLPNIGVTFFKEIYIESRGAYVTYDGGKSIENSANVNSFWTQYGLSGMPATVIDGDLSTLKSSMVDLYYLVVDGRPDQEITYFYTADGSLPTNLNQVRYICIDYNEANKMATAVTGKIAGSVKDSYKFFSVDNEELANKNLSEVTVDFPEANCKIKRKTVRLYTAGYIEYTDDPLIAAPTNASSAANKVVKFVKHIHYEDSSGEKPIMNQSGSSSNFMTNGYVYYLGLLNENGANIIDSLASVGVDNKSPTTYYTGGDYVTHIFETDFYVDSSISGLLTQMYIFNGSDVLWQMNIQNRPNDGTIWFNIENGPGNSNAHKIFNASGQPVGAGATNEIVAGSDGAVTVGKVMNARQWYKLRVEYVAEKDNMATIRIYIDGELCSYIRDSANTTSDDNCTLVRFMHTNGSRDTRLYLDNTYFASIGETELVPPDNFDDGREDYYGQGKYYEQSEKFPSTFVTDSPSHNVITETDADGNNLDNTVLEVHKFPTSLGPTINFESKNKSGNIYIFETDFKFIGTDNTTSWLAKMQLINNMVGGDDYEFGMVCFKYKEDITGKYWTLSNQDSEFKDANGNVYKGVANKWYNIRFEFNPADRNTKIYMNGEYFTELILPLSGRGTDDTSFAGIGFNLRANPAGTTYTKFILDNTIATTLESDFIGDGQYYDESEHYDDYDAGDNAGIKVESEGENNYLNMTSGTLTELLTQNRGHKYVYETDIKWNGAKFNSDDVESATALSFKLYSGENVIFELIGSSNNGETSLNLKVGKENVGQLSLGYWSNLRVVYTPAETETAEVELEDGSTEYRTVYGGTCELYVNGSLLWRSTVEKMSNKAIYVDNTSFDKAELTVGTDVASVNVFIDNTYVTAHFIDDIGNGDNFSDSDNLENDELAGTNHLITSSTIFGATLVNGVNTVEMKLKLEWNGKFDTATSTANVATIDFVDEEGNTITSISLNVNKVTGRVDILDASLALEEWYTVSVASLPGSEKYVISIAADSAPEEPVFAQLTAPTADFVGVKLRAGEDTVVYTDDESDSFIIDKILIPTTGTAGTAYSFNADLAVSWNGVLANGTSAEAAAFSFVDILGREFFRITANAVKDSSGAVTVDICVNGQVLKNIPLDTLYTLTVTAENGKYSVTLTLVSDTNDVTSATYELAMSETFAGVVVSAADGAAIELQNASCGLKNEYNRVDGNANVTHEIMNSETVGVTHTYETDIRVYWNGLLAAGELSRKVFEITLADSKGEGFFTIYGVVKADRPGYVTLSLTEDGEGGFYELPAGVWYNVKVEISDGGYSVTVKGKVRASGDIVLPLDFVKAVTTVSADAVVDTDNTCLKTVNENLKGKGDNSSNAIENYETSVENGDIEYDPTLGEVDPDDEFTDSYIDINTTDITMGKKTTSSSNVLTFLSSSAGKNTLYVFETDIYWQGSVLGSVSGTESVFHEISLLGNTVIDGESVEVVLATVYAVGVCAVDTVATDVQYLLLYTSLEEGSEPVAAIRQDLWYNLRMEYDAANGDTTVFVNNTSVATVDGDVIEGVSFAGTEIKLGDDVYDTVVKLQKTYIAAVAPASKNG